MADRKAVHFKLDSVSYANPITNDGCPYCGSSNTVKNGWRDTPKGRIQRFECKKCYRRFSDPQSKSLNSTSQGTGDRITKENANEMTVSETIIGNSETVISPQLDQLIIQYTNHLLKQAQKPSTITGKVKLLKRMHKLNAPLLDPEEMKLFIAKQTAWSSGRKRNAVHAYTSYLEMMGGTWDPPYYESLPKPIWIPLETEVDQLIAACSPRNAAFLQLLKETGMRPGEAHVLTWKDIDHPIKKVHITPEKGSNPRTLPISDKVIAMLFKLKSDSQYVFKTTSLKHFGDGYRKQRKRIAVKLDNPRINQIQFKTLRHFYATKFYYDYKDILTLKYNLGHKNIKNTMVYTHLVNFPKDDKWVPAIAKNSDEACHLIEAGFQFEASTPEGYMLFKKRK